MSTGCVLHQPYSAFKRHLKHMRAAWATTASEKHVGVTTNVQQEDLQQSKRVILLVSLSAVLESQHMSRDQKHQQYTHSIV